MSLDDARLLESLNVVVDDRMSFSSVGNRFYARGAATENARSPNRRSVRVQVLLQVKSSQVNAVDERRLF